MLVDRFLQNKTHNDFENGLFLKAIKRHIHITTITTLLFVFIQNKKLATSVSCDEGEVSEEEEDEAVAYSNGSDKEKSYNDSEKNGNLTWTLKSSSKNLKVQIFTKFKNLLFCFVSYNDPTLNTLSTNLSQEVLFLTKYFLFRYFLRVYAFERPFP